MYLDVTAEGMKYSSITERREWEIFVSDTVHTISRFLERKKNLENWPCFIHSLHYEFHWKQRTHFRTVVIYENKRTMTNSKLKTKIKLCVCSFLIVICLYGEASNVLPETRSYQILTFDSNDNSDTVKATTEKPANE